MQSARVPPPRGLVPIPALAAPGAFAATLAALGVLAAPTAANAQTSPTPAPPPADYGATARVQRLQPTASATADAEDVRALRQTMGDGFRLVETLPGTTPVFSGVPYLLVRGAPPAGTVQYYDGVPVPSFFHLALGPAIAHPSLVSGMRFHAGVAPARYGRRVGGVLAIDGPTPASAPELEGELRLLDGQALARSVGPWPVAAHARIGYPNLALDAIDSQASLRYGDYQLHGAGPLGRDLRLTLHAFGAYDGLGDRLQPQDDIDLEFHRMLLRLQRTRGATAVTASLYAGYDRGRLGGELDARTLRLGPAVHLERRIGHTRVRVGADMEARLAELRSGDEVMAPSPERPLVTGPDDPDRFLPDLDADISIETGPEDFVERSPLRAVPGRNALGVYAELSLADAGPVDVDTGVRSDLWIVGDHARVSFDARLLSRLHASRTLRLHAGLGTAHQAASSPLPIPGLDAFELDEGLSRALQSEAGAELDLPLDITLEAALFHHRFEHLVFLELVLDCDGNSDPRALFVVSSGPARVLPQCRRDGLPRGSGTASGLELHVRRDLGQRLTGWLSYTLAWADARSSDGTAFVPQFDVRHLANLVLSWNWGGGLASGARLHYRSGKPAVNTIFDFTRDEFERRSTRLPAFFRADVQLTYTIDASFGDVQLLLSLANLTFAREATKRDCFLERDLSVRCEVDYQPAIVLPNAGVRVRL